MEWNEQGYYSLLSGIFLLCWRYYSDEIIIRFKIVPINPLSSFYNLALWKILALVKISAQTCIFNLDRKLNFGPFWQTFHSSAEKQPKVC